MTEFLSVRVAKERAFARHQEKEMNNMPAVKKKKKKKQASVPLLEQKSERNMGVELFRIMSMVLVILLHVLGHGGVLGRTEHLSTNYKIAWFLETLAYCSVNCYAIISGFANVKTKFKFRRFVNLWLETVVMILSITAIVHFWVPSVDVPKEWWIAAVLPLLKRELWYFCAYFFMYPLIPLINKGLLSLSRWQHIVIIIWLQVPTIFKLIQHKDNYVLSSGYSAMWLICLYVLGAYFRIYGPPKWGKWFVTLPVFFIAAFVAWFKRIYIEMQFEKGLVEKESIMYDYRDDLISYVSPCMVIMATMLLIFFMQVKIRFKPTKVIISNLAKTTWGVFVLHVCSAGWYWDEFWDAFRVFGEYPAGKMVASVFWAVIKIFMAGAFLTLCKIYIFKWCGIDKLINYLADLPEKLISRKKDKNEKKEKVKA